MDYRLTQLATALRLTLGATATLAGLDKFFNILADWGAYVSPTAARLLPVSTELFLRGVGVVEMAVGIAILAVAPAIGAYAASAWLLLVAVNLILAGHLDVAVRDVVMSIAALTLARLIELRAPASADALEPRVGSIGAARL
jgi:hypothetical protein